ncbi:S8 family serine peptidase [Roseibaca sp. Y0-43]|nr:S8 family serine peptidase [Roseibaca sp. Y0-43]
MSTPTDPLYGNQWHFPLMGDIETIWDDYSGAGVHVVVFDDGFDYTHPDLVGNYVDYRFVYNGVTYNPYPLVLDDDHGTAVAGLIGMTANNGIGGTGVAPGVAMTGVNFLSDIQFDGAGAILASLEFAGNFDIMSNS